MLKYEVKLSPDKYFGFLMLNSWLVFFSNDNDKVQFGYHLTLPIFLPRLGNDRRDFLYSLRKPMGQQ